MNNDNELPPPVEYTGSAKALSNSKFLAASDLIDAGIPHGGSATVTIAKVLKREGVVSQFTGKPETMRTLLLSGKHKELRANQTTWKTLITLFGDDTQEWIGKKIQLVLAQKEVKGELLDTIFVRGVQAPKVKPPAPKAPPAGVHPDDGDLVPDTGSDDSVPF